jgi:hypothetical protein
MQQFQELGALVESRWREQNYNEDLFPEIAAHALAESDLTEQVDPWEVIRWVHRTPSLPRQQDRKGKFGNPPITLFVGSRFYIDVYFWLDGTTSIHQHAFSGAFQVLLGSSVHSHYRFEKDREINPYFLTGEVLLQDVSLLVKGDIKEIRPGPRFIHSLFHLERPSATITVRNDHSPHDAIQYSYLKPYVAFDPFFEDDSFIKKVQTVSLLLGMKHPEADQFIADLLDAADFQTTFALLDTAFRFLGNNEMEGLFQLSKSSDRFEALLNRARLRHGLLTDLLPPVFAEKQRQNDITKRRGMIEGRGHRFFLALLLNVPERTMVLDLIRQKFPEADPVELAVGWIKEMAAIRIFGSPEPNVLGIKNFEPSHLTVFEGLLRGLSIGDIEKLANTKASFVQNPQLPIADVIEGLKALPLFKSMFAGERMTTPSVS